MIANTFFRAGFIEAWGRGIEKIKESCREAGNPIPKYTIKREDIMVMFQSLVSNTNQANQGAEYSVEGSYFDSNSKGTDIVSEKNCESYWRKIP